MVGRQGVAELGDGGMLIGQLLIDSRAVRYSASAALLPIPDSSRRGCGG